MKSSSVKILTVAVVLLLLTNIALVFFMFFRHPKGPDRRRKDPSEMMVKELNMTPDQQKQFREMKDAHFQSVKPLFDSMRAEKSTLIDLLKEKEVSDSLFTAYNKNILEKQARIDRLTFEHFRKVRTLFTPEQQPRFDSLLRKMMARKRDSADRK